MPEGAIAVDDPLAPDVLALLQRHLAFASANTPAENIHALDPASLVGPAITFFSFRHDGAVLAVGALRQLDAKHAELKSMHTAEAARGLGIGRAMVGHLLAVARERGVCRVSLETGTGPGFASARALYAKAGFLPCGPFGGYRETPDNTFLTLPLDD